MIDLCICIPTYNRQEKLLRQLHCVFEQPEVSEVDVIVLNNHSDYDVEAAVYADFPQSQYTNLKVITHPCNIGGNLNISMCFYHCTRKWMWMISDDDTVTADSLKIIKGDMERFADSIVVKYSIAGTNGYQNSEVSTLKDFVQYIKSQPTPFAYQNPLIFISNGIYNIEKLSPVRGQLVEYGYNSMIAINPIFIGLDRGLGSVRFRSDSLVNRGKPQGKMGHDWSMNYHYIMGRLVALLDYPFECSGETILDLLSTQDHWNFNYALKSVMLQSDRKKLKMFYDRVFPLLFGKNPKKKFIFKTVYYFYYYLHIDLLKIFKGK